MAMRAQDGYTNAAASRHLKEAVCNLPGDIRSSLTTLVCMLSFIPSWWGLPRLDGSHKNTVAISMQRVSANRLP
eukprot:COSAG03_NODE_2181_length_3039_cov_3.187075_3_plen_74_part_00